VVQGKTLFEIIKSYCNTTVLADLNRRFELIEQNREKWVKLQKRGKYEPDSIVTKKLS
jgi:hypothetical protein